MKTVAEKKRILEACHSDQQGRIYVVHTDLVTVILFILKVPFHYTQANKNGAKSLETARLTSLYNLNCNN